MRTTSRLTTVLAVMALAAGGCGGGESGSDPHAEHDTTTETAAPEPTPQEEEPRPTRNAAPPATTARGKRGRRLVAESGCFACHQLGGSGNDGPGPSLAGIGDELRPAQSAEQLVDPEPPMPSFASLPAADRAAIVEYLSSLQR